jgi:hypothetical protein
MKVISVIEVVSMQGGGNPVAVLAIEHPLWIFPGGSASLLFSCRGKIERKRR